ncbi:O-fucosyltransferase 7 isoform X3 [Senna tora]|uniref:O-fucosyltransferase 7 isoform X3 n=1 Tax=Senna tora TaxID=362788 RepID=A0A834WV28_9FABA|nr:O-fucosyltransferase 7 isoform X3 [Senna tora]
MFCRRALSLKSLAVEIPPSMLFANNFYGDYIKAIPGEWQVARGNRRASDYGLMKVDNLRRITEFAEKPEGPAVARIINATLVIPEHDKKSYWQDSSYIFVNIDNNMSPIKEADKRHR